MAEFWNIPIDESGLVIYFGVNGRPFLFNGHKGLFYDSLPEHAVQVFEVLSKPKKDQPAAIESLRRKHGDRCDRVWNEIQLYRDGTHPALAPETRQERFCQRLCPRIFNVYVSQTCNLSCRYCINQRGTFGNAPSVMSVETARDLLAFIAKTLTRGIHPTVTVILFGGEPLLSRQALYTLVRGLQDLNRANLQTRVHIVLSTNGTIYDKEIFDVIAEQPDCNTVVVSLDAFKERHDENRPFADSTKGSTYDAVLGNLRGMIGAGIPYSVTCVVPYPYDYIGAAEELHRLGIKLLEIKPIIRHVFGRPDSDLPDVFADDFPLWRKNYLAYSDYYIEHLNVKSPARHSDRFAVYGDYGQAFAGGGDPLRRVSCGVADVKIGVSSDGRLLPCEGFVGQQGFEIGNVRTGFDEANYDRFAEWVLSRGQFRVEDGRCRNCYANRICGGGCYAVSYDESGDLRPPPESSCK